MAEQVDSDKDAEIARLKAALEYIDDHGRALSFMETLKAQQAEIEMWKTSFGELDRKVQQELYPEIERQKAIIAQLCDDDYGDALTRANAEIVRLKEENAHFAWRDEDKNELIAQLKAVTNKDLEPIA